MQFTPWRTKAALRVPRRAQLIRPGRSFVIGWESGVPIRKPEFKQQDAICYQFSREIEGNKIITNPALWPQRLQDSNERVTWILCWNDEATATQTNIFPAEEPGLEGDSQNNRHELHRLPADRQKTRASLREAVGGDVSGCSSCEPQGASASGRSLSLRHQHPSFCCIRVRQGPCTTLP